MVALQSGSLSRSAQPLKVLKKLHEMFLLCHANITFLLVMCFVYLGVGNLLVTAAAEMAAIPYSKIKRFAYILNLQFIEKTTYYRLRCMFISNFIYLSSLF